MQVDAGRQLERAQRAATRRGRGRRVRAVAVAAAIAIFAGVLVWQLRAVDRDVVPAGTPTGRIAFLGTQGSGRGAFGFDVATGATTAISDDSLSVLAAAWSPDGSRIAYVAEEPGPRYTLLVADADGSDPVVIVDEEDTGAVGPDMIDVTWSPDGSRIAYAGRVVEDGVARRTILIVNADGTGEPTVLDHHWESVSWSQLAVSPGSGQAAPDGRLLLSGFAGDDGPFVLTTVRPDGTDHWLVSEEATGVHRALWSPDGERIVFFMGDGDYELDIYVMNADGSGMRRLTDWRGIDSLPGLVARRGVGRVRQRP